MPSDAILLVVTVEGGDPLAPTPVRVAPSIPRPLVVDDPGAGQWVDARRVRVYPAVLAGELEIVDDAGWTRLRIPIDATTTNPLVVEVGAVLEAVAIFQILPDGRHSEYVSFD